MDCLDPLDHLDLVVALVKLDPLVPLDLLDLPDPLAPPVADSTLASSPSPRRRPLIPSVSVLTTPM